MEIDFVFRIEAMINKLKPDKFSHFAVNFKCIHLYKIYFLLIRMLPQFVPND